jgi:hypothetical protein
MSQQALASALEAYAAADFPEMAKTLRQNTIGYWERGTLPRKPWLTVIAAFTKNKVTADDFVAEDTANGPQ